MQLRSGYPTPQELLVAATYLKSYLSNWDTCTSEDGWQWTKGSRKLQGKPEELPGTNNFESWEILRLRSCFSTLEWSATLNLFFAISRYFGGKKWRYPQLRSEAFRLLSIAYKVLHSLTQIAWSKLSLSSCRLLVLLAEPHSKRECHSPVVSIKASGFMCIDINWIICTSPKQITVILIGQARTWGRGRCSSELPGLSMHGGCSLMKVGVLLLEEGMDAGQANPQIRPNLIHYEVCLVPNPILLKIYILLVPFIEAVAEVTGG